MSSANDSNKPVTNAAMELAMTIRPIGHTTDTMISYIGKSVQ
jgi:hypothetical protein